MMLQAWLKIWGVSWGERGAHCERCWRNKKLKHTVWGEREEVWEKVKSGQEKEQQRYYDGEQRGQELNVRGGCEITGGESQDGAERQMKMGSDYHTTAKHFLAWVARARARFDSHCILIWPVSTFSCQRMERHSVFWWSLKRLLDPHKMLQR